MVRKSEVLNSSSVFVEGIGFISNTAKVELPKIEFETFEAKSGIAVHSINTTVLKKMEAKFELNEVNKVYFEAIAKRQKQKSTFWVKKNTNKNATDSQTTVTLKGSVDVFEFPNGDIGTEEKSVLSLTVDFFKYEKDGQTLVLIDVDNLVCEINGEDLWQNQRDFLVG